MTLDAIAIEIARIRQGLAADANAAGPVHHERWVIRRAYRELTDLGVAVVRATLSLPPATDLPGRPYSLYHQD